MKATTTAASTVRGTLKPILVAGLVVTLTFAGAGTALAAKGGNGRGGGGGGTPTTTATVVATPNPVGIGQYYTISGTGYTPGAQLNVKLYGATIWTSISAWGDSTGKFSFMHRHWYADTIRLEVWQLGSRDWTLMATGSYTVVP